MSETSAATLLERLITLPRVALGHFPTPLDEAPHLSQRLGVHLLVKRDDATGLALGGNKVRKLEFLLGAAQAEGADAIITTGGSQSNHARLTAAACRVLGLSCYLVLDRGVHPEFQGNLMLDALFGAEVRLIESADPADAVAGMQAWAAELRAAGRKPFIIPRGGSVATGAAGYAAMVAELLDQLQARGESLDLLYLATGSTGTHAGTLAGTIAAGALWQIRGISVSRPREAQEAKVHDLIRSTLDLLGIPAEIPADAIKVDDRFRGPAYGVPTAATMEAIRTAARDEALILDPVYTAKAMAGLLAHATEGRIPRGSTVLFLHTGGAPGLFAYHDEVAAAVGA